VHPDQTRKRSAPALPLLSAAICRTVRLQLLFTLGALLVATPLGAAASFIETSAPQSERLDQKLTKPALDRQIERVLQNPEYSWRESSAPTQRPERKSIFERWMAPIRQMLLSLGSWISRFLK
jgi:hypothetical protein